MFAVALLLVGVEVFLELHNGIILILILSLTAVKEFL
jgi:hypothetical protein